MNRFFHLCILLCAIVISTSAMSQTVAVLNIQEIMRESLAAKAIRQKLESKQKSFQSELSQKEQELQEKERTLAKQRSVLTGEEFEKRVKDFRAQATKAQRDVQTKKAKLDKAFAEALASIQKSVTSIVADMAKEKKFSVVMPTSQLLYADPALDITDQVLTELNKRLPTVNVNF